MSRYMKRTWAGGVLDYQKLAQQHRPADPERLAAEVRRLAGQGLTERDIAQARKLDVATVRAALAARGDAAAAVHLAPAAKAT